MEFQGDHNERPCAEGADDAPASWHRHLSTDSPHDVTLPHREMAIRLDGCVERLLPWVHLQPDEGARDGYVDLMVGLSIAAEAIRAAQRCEAEVSVSRLRSAIRYLRRAAASNMCLPHGRVWDAPDR